MPDLDTSPGDQCNSARQVRAEVAHLIIECRTLRAEEVIEEVDRGVVLLADVTGFRLVQLLRGMESGRKKGSRCGKRIPLDLHHRGRGFERLVLGALPLPLGVEVSALSLTVNL